MPDTTTSVFSSPGIGVPARGRPPGSQGCLARGHPPRGISLGLRCNVSSPQEWIKDTQNVAHVNKLEAAEQECIPEDALVVHLVKNEAETPIVTTSPLCPQTEEEEASGDPSQLPFRPMHGGEMVSLGGFTFVMSDNSYITL